MLEVVEWRRNALYRQRDPASDRLADRLDQCCREPNIVTLEEGTVHHLTENRCKSRVCPRCSKIRARELSTRIADLVHRMDAPRFLTLTIRSNDQPLRDQVKHLTRRFAAMRRTNEWPKRVTGGIYTIEITWNGNSGQWHPHLHAIIDGTYWQQTDLLDLWQRVIHDQGGVDIRAIQGIRKLANYLAAYVSKSCDLAKLPRSQLAEWAIETQSLRLAQTFGSIHRVKPGREEPEPHPTWHVDFDVNDLASWAEAGETDATRLLQIIEPRGLLKGKASENTIAGLISYLRIQHAPPRGPPPPNKHQQLHFARK